MQKISPSLWFDSNAEAAVKFYCSVFKKSKVLNRSYRTKAIEQATGKPAGSVLTISFRLEDQELLALNGGPEFKFTPAISMVVLCKNQRELDRLWNKLSAGGAKGRCGWLTDKFGISWQVVPASLHKLIVTRNAVKIDALMQALRGMKKINIKKLEAAYANA